MGRRQYESVEEYAPGNEDYEYDSARQKLVDARSEGEQAGRHQLAVELCPYFDFEPEYKEWHAGRLETLGSQQRRVA